MQPAAGAYEGKAKRVTPLSPTEIAVYFKDDATAFNGQKHAQFAGKGELNSLMTEALFGFLEKSGVRTHHLGRIDARTLRARSLVMFPLEVVVRFKVAGSLEKRTGLAENTPCEPAVVELYLKNDALGDPILNDDHVRLLKAATPAEVSTLRQMALDAATKLKRLCDKAGLDLVDLKLEYGKADGAILLADEISPDTARLRDAKTGTILDKDRFRRDLGDLMEGYREIWARLGRALAELPHV